MQPKKANSVKDGNEHLSNNHRPLMFVIFSYLSLSKKEDSAKY